MESEIQEPYVGPRPFKREDQKIFFGRENESSDLLSLIIANRALLVYSPSGAGKTSLLHAKLIPMLEEKRGFEVLPVARVRSFTTTQGIRPEEILNIYVFNTLMSWFDSKSKYKIEQLVGIKIPSYLKQIERKTGEDSQPSPRAVIFDQFEELFTWHQERWKDREDFFKQISEALEGDPLLRVVFVMREDHIAKLDPYVHLLPENLRARFHIDRLRREAALMAVKDPVNIMNRSFGDDVAERLVDDLLKIKTETEISGKTETIEATGEFVETLQLQVVCQSLWRQLSESDRQITMDHLNKYGDVDRALSSFYDEAVKKAVEQTVKDKTHIADEEKHLRDWFGEVLITSMGTRGTVYRAPEFTGGIPNRVIAILEDEHIIRAEWRAGARWYELTHDRFIEPIRRSNESYRLKTTGAQDKEEKRMSISKIIISAEQAWGAHNYDDAIKNYEEALDIYKKLGDSVGEKNTLFSLGRIYSEIRKYEDAIDKYQRTIEIDPKFALAHNEYALLLEELDQHAEAEEHYLKAIEIDPKLAEAYYNYALMLEELNRTDEAGNYHMKIRELGDKCIEVSLEVSTGLRTLKPVDECGSQAYEGYRIIGPAGKVFEFNIDKCLTLNFTMKAQKDTDTSFLLMVHDKVPLDQVSRFVVIGKTPAGNPGFYDTVEDCIVIKDDGQWHDYTYSLKTLKEYYPDAETIRIIQFYSYRGGDGTSHEFNIRRLLVH